MGTVFAHPCPEEGWGAVMSQRTLIAVEDQQSEQLATEAIFTAVYDELRNLAHQKLRHEQPGQALETTELVHEAFLRLIGPNQDASWENQGHFFAAAAEAMRRILIELARRRKCRRHGGDRNRVSLDQACPCLLAASDDLLDINDAIDRLEIVEPQKARLVKLRFFAGMTIAEASRALGISHATAERHWAFSRAWLYCELGHKEGNESGNGVPN